MKNMITWFEIPTSDFQRAVNFYKNVFQFEILEVPMGDYLMGMFPSEGYNSSGCLIYGEMCVPSASGVVIYFHCENDLIPYLERVEQNNGKIIVPKTLVSDEIGYFASFIDSEGNRVNLHSLK